MRTVLISVLSSFIGAVVGFGFMAIIDYSANFSTDEPGFAEASFSPLDAQVSIAKATWSQAYWLKRLTLAAEMEAAKPCVEAEKFVRGLHGALRSAEGSVENSPLMVIEPHADEP